MVKRPPSLNEIRGAIRTVPDFPKKGILFRDITPLLLDGPKFKSCIDRFVKMAKGKTDLVVSIESRGFILGSAMAHSLGVGFVPISKAGKLPYRTFEMEYELEYGKARVEIHEDAIPKGARVALIDDVLATGGTMKAATELMHKFGAKITGIYFLVDLKALKGASKLKRYPVRSLITF
jgi:adenine phosphoribosyltransferase